MINNRRGWWVAGVLASVGVWSSAGSATAAPRGAVCDTPVALPANANPHWTYEESPAEWAALAGYGTCGTGKAQTPIDIPTAGATTGGGVPHFVGYGNIPLIVEQNGHTVQADYVAKNDGTDPHFDLGGKTYNFVQFHFHAPSEHKLDGKSYAAELHLVHKAADGSLAVVGVFIATGAANAELGRVLGSVPPAKTKTSCPGSNVNLGALIPTSGTLWSYAPGSLTTPPCSEGVTWFVSGKPLTITPAQLKEFVQATSSHTNRPIQPLNGRSIAKLSL